MSPAKTALIVIDVQESFRHMPYWSEEGLETFLHKQQALIDAAVAAGVPIVQIFHTRVNSPFDPAGDFVVTMDGISISPDVIFHKTKHSAFAGTGLDIWLRQNGISKLVISGIRTEQCCETTTRHASDQGFAVDFVSEATYTMAMTHASGTRFSPDDIRMRTELVLADRFARIASVDDVRADWAVQEAA